MGGAARVRGTGVLGGVRPAGRRPPLAAGHPARRRGQRRPRRVGRRPRSLTVAVRPSQNLVFSPLASTRGRRQLTGRPGRRSTAVAAAPGALVAVRPAGLARAARRRRHRDQLRRRGNLVGACAPAPSRPPGVGCGAAVRAVRVTSVSFGRMTTRSAAGGIAVPAVPRCSPTRRRRAGSGGARAAGSRPRRVAGAGTSSLAAGPADRTLLHRREQPCPRVAGRAALDACGCRSPAGCVAPRGRRRAEALGAASAAGGPTTSPGPGAAVDAAAAGARGTRCSRRDRGGTTALAVAGATADRVAAGQGRPGRRSQRSACRSSTAPPVSRIACTTSWTTGRSTRS